jgi:hypothetical protein
VECHQGNHIIIVVVVIIITASPFSEARHFIRQSRLSVNEL